MSTSREISPFDQRQMHRYLRVGLESMGLLLTFALVMATCMFLVTAGSYLFEQLLRVDGLQLARIVAGI